MSGLAIISPRDMAKLVKMLGYELHRQKGSHRIYRTTDGKTVTIPFHNEDLGRGLIRKILSDLEITVERYNELRKVL